MNRPKSNGGVVVLSITWLIVCGAMPATSGVLKPGDLVVLDRHAEIHRVDPITGQKLLLSSDGFLTDGYSQGVAIDSNGDLLVTVSVTNRSVTIFPFGRVVRIDPDTGSQSLAAQTFPMAGASGIAIDRSGNYIVAALRDKKILSTDPTTRAESVLVLAGAAQFATRLLFDDCGDLITDGHSTLVRTHLKTGSQTMISEKRKIHPFGISLDDHGDLIVLDRLPSYLGSAQVIRMDPFTGDSTTINSDPILGFPSALAVGTDGTIFVGATGEPNPFADDGEDNLVRVDPETGEHFVLTKLGRITDIAVVPEITDRRERWKKKRRCRKRRMRSHRYGKR